MFCSKQAPVLGAVLSFVLGAALTFGLLFDERCIGPSRIHVSFEKAKYSSLTKGNFLQLEDQTACAAAEARYGDWRKIPLPGSSVHFPQIALASFSIEREREVE